jgi:N,N'-diacetylbacillosaminyl-diphospho-undecaprenol alpha-1,3-N-acetylgalactosaminyltransferase
MIIHLIHHPVSAKRFVEPLVKSLNVHGVQSELWIENNKEMEDFIRTIDCPKRFAKFDLSFNPLSLLLRIIRLSRRFMQTRPKAVHAHQTRAAFIPLIAAMIARVPLRIYHSHGTPYLGYRGPLRGLLWLLEFLDCRFATHVITVSHSIRNKMIEHHLVRESKCRVLGHGSSYGIDFDEFSMQHFDEQHAALARQSLGISPDAFVVLYVGRPFRRKGFHMLLDAWRKMRIENNGSVLLIAGCSNEDVINITGSPLGNVKALGYVKDMRVCYAACHIVVLPSWHEGLPYSLLEGAAAAKPLVGSDIPGIDSIISGTNGMLVPVGDVEALVKAITTFKEDCQLGERMGYSGRKYVEQYFDRKEFGQFLLDFYEQIGIKSNLDEDIVVSNGDKAVVGSDKSKLHSA